VTKFGGLQIAGAGEVGARAMRQEMFRDFDRLFGPSTGHDAI